jgi:ABC-type glutathione transport system ATPase component|tara:strand:- start:184 stop:1029 length:846 start_codon:yes stop_codon:yes gene_type:complete
MSAIVTLENVGFSFPDKSGIAKDGWVTIFKNVSLAIKKKQIVGLVGKSGCGKTTLGKLLVNYFRLNNEDCKLSGKVYYHENKNAYDITNLEYRRKYRIQPIQMIFQDPKISLNMKMKVYDQLKEAILTKKKLTRQNTKDTVFNLAKQFKIYKKLESIPENMSGGERRRLGIAKIIATEPKVIIADEPVASLDVSIKYEIMEILLGLNERDCTIVIISHDINLIKKHTDIIFVMDEGTLVEQWDPSQVPNHPATKQLLKDSAEINAPLANLVLSNGDINPNV